MQKIITKADIRKKDTPKKKAETDKGSMKTMKKRN